MLIGQNNFRIPAKNIGRPAFKADVEMTKGAEKQIEDGVIEANIMLYPQVNYYKDFYGKGPGKHRQNLFCPDTKQVKEDLVKEIKYLTRNNRGTVMIKEGPKNLGMPVISYKTPDGKVYDKIRIGEYELKPCIHMYDALCEHKPNYDLLLTDGNDVIFSEFINPNMPAEELAGISADLAKQLGNSNGLKSKKSVESSQNQTEINKGAGEADEDSIKVKNTGLVSKNIKIDQEYDEFESGEDDEFVEEFQEYLDLDDEMYNELLPAGRGSYMQDKLKEGVYGYRNQKVKEKYEPTALPVINALYQLIASNTPAGLTNKNKFTKAVKAAQHPNFLC